MLCRYCGKRPASGGVFCSTCFRAMPNSLTTIQYLGALTRIRERIASGTPITLDDSNVIGDKYTHCAWGVCTESKEVWNNPEYHIWPVDFVEHGRVAPLTRPSKCPLDSRESLERHDGCFYKCLAFRPSKGFVLTSDYALTLYDAEIAKLKATIAAERR